MLFPAGASEWIEGKNVLWQLGAFLALFFLTVAVMDVLFKLPFSFLFSLCVAGYAVEHIAYHTTKLVTCAAAFLTNASAAGSLADVGGATAMSPWTQLSFVLPSVVSFVRPLLAVSNVVLLSVTSPWASPAAVSIFGCDPEYIVFPIVYIAVFLTLGLFAARNECWKKWDMRFNLLSIALVFICVGLTRVAVAYDGENFIPVKVYAITSCTMALVVQFVLYRVVDLRAENTAVHLMWQEERKQYELSKKTIDTINI